MADSAVCDKVEKALTLMGKRWVTLIIYQLLESPKRFCEFESSIGISGRVLSERLKELEEEGIVQRKVYDETPVRVEYTLTDKGKAMEPVIRCTQEWAEEWL